MPPNVAQRHFILLPGPLRLRLLCRTPGRPLAPNALPARRLAPAQTYWATRDGLWGEAAPPAAPDSESPAGLLVPPPHHCHQHAQRKSQTHARAHVDTHTTPNQRTHTRAHARARTRTRTCTDTLAHTAPARASLPSRFHAMYGREKLCIRPREALSMRERGSAKIAPEDKLRFTETPPPPSRKQRLD